MQSQRLSAAAPIRIYDDSDQTTSRPLSPSMTLSQFYKAFYRPVCLQATGKSPRNVDQYNQSIGFWQRYGRNRVSGDEDAAIEPFEPSLDQINDFTIANFMTALMALPGKRKGEEISPNTIRKHCIHLQAVIDRAGPRGHVKRLRKAQSLIVEVPFFERPEKREKEVDDDFTLEEISRFLAACRHADVPRYLPDPKQRERFWLNLLVGSYNIGLRIGSVLKCEWSKLAQDHRGDWWITVQVKRGHSRRFFVNQFALRAIENMRVITGGHPNIWHWPHKQNWLQVCRQRLLAESGIPPHRQLGFHALRKAMITHAAPINEMAASMQAGHKSTSTTRESYTNKRAVGNTMQQLPQPKMPDDEQKRLF